MDLKEEIHILKEDFSNFKKEVITRTEDQFLIMKSQIAKIMEEISLLSQIAQNVKSTVTNLQLNLNASSSSKENSQQLLFESANKADLIVKDQTMIIDVCKKENETLEKKYVQMNKENYPHTTEFIYIPKNISRNSKNLKVLDDDCVGDNIHENYQQILSHHSSQPRVKICCLTCKSKERIIEQDRRETKHILARVKKLEKAMKECLRCSSSFLENIMSQALHDISEKLDENSFDIEQCWAETEELKEKNTIIMLNGDFVNAEDEINRMNFELEALLIQSEEQSLLIDRLWQKIEEKQIDTGELTLAWRQDIHHALENIVKTLQADWRVDITISFQNFQNKVCIDKFRKFPIQWAKGTGKKVEDVMGKDIVLTRGISTDRDTRHKCITAMTQYEKWSLEELRHIDYEGLDAETLPFPTYQLTTTSSFSNDTAPSFFQSSEQNTNSNNQLLSAPNGFNIQRSLRRNIKVSRRGKSKFNRK
ncbi:hypothetical protein Btru_010814 [Bulinus truncatus]|nr:hypothetical protein Btru_010814 [Bulinus truncatus]